MLLYQAMLFATCSGKVVLCAAALALLSNASAQTNFSIYSDQLDNGFQNWSWNPGDYNFTNSSPVNSGSNSVAFTGGAWEAISFEHSNFNPAPYANLNFFINGGGAGGQVIQIYVQYGTNSAPAYQLPALPATTNWQQIMIPFNTLHIAGVTNLNRINFQLTPSGSVHPFYLDDVNLTAVPSSPVHLKVDASQVLRPADSRWFGLNTAVWDDDFNTATTIQSLAEAGTKILRFPGGSLSDTYHWTTNSSWDGVRKIWTKWGTSFNSFIHVATNIGAQAMITVDYGMGTSNEAAAWVRSANVTNHLGFRYWEIGNECYGTWETDSNSLPNDPYTYAHRARDYITQMKAADPTIKIGVVVTPGENTYINNFNHFAINPRTGTTNYGWTPVMLSTLKSLGVTPDFLIHHVYPEYGVDADQSLLLDSGNWPGDAADLRQQISDYVGNTGTNIELICTENNSDSGTPGRQSTSIVNGVYLADSLAQLMKTEINGFIWWDLRNGTDTNGDFDSALYGWRNFGDLGVINGLNTRLPVYYTFKLMQNFAQPGDTVLNASTDYALLTTYASRKADGALAVLVINKDRSATFSSQLSLANYLPWTNALVRSFGIAQDEATRTNSTVPGAQDIGTNYMAVMGTNISATFPPYSVTLLTIPPAAPILDVQLAPDGQYVLQVQGQANVRYVVQEATNLTTWTPMATNTLSGATWSMTNSLSAPVKFWRAMWLP
jgi:alpha-N-arabinofuranosidase